jgi:hypothetical protein
MQSWNEHFEVVGNHVQGRTATGRATVVLLMMNAERRVALRGALSQP